MLPRQLIVATVLTLAAVAAVALAQTSSRPILTSKVVAVTDGEALTILTADKRQVKIRLEGIDAPESGQPFGTKARVALSSKVFDSLGLTLAPTPWPTPFHLPTRPSERTLEDAEKVLGVMRL